MHQRICLQTWKYSHIIQILRIFTNFARKITKDMNDSIKREQSQLCLNSAERKGLKWIHKATFPGYQPAIDYCKEHGYKWY